MRRMMYFVVCAAIVVSACTSTNTSPAPYVPPPPPVSNQVPLPGSSESFFWWTRDVLPEKDTQLVMGQQVDVGGLKCSGPAGYSFAIATGFSNGPGTNNFPSGPWPWQNFIGFGGGETKDCSAIILSGSGSSWTVDANTPDLPYYRYKVWVRQGSAAVHHGPGYTEFMKSLGEPDRIIDVYLGWKKPK